MKAVSLRHPHAWNVVHGNKRIENRSWYTHHRGDLLIHASSFRKGEQLPHLTASDYGVLYGVVELYDIVPYEQVSDDPFATSMRPQSWCWLLRTPRSIEHIPCKGLASMFNVDDSLIKYVSPGDILIPIPTKIEVRGPTFEVESIAETLRKMRESV